MRGGDPMRHGRLGVNSPETIDEAIVFPKELLENRRVVARVIRRFVMYGWRLNRAGGA